MLAYALARISSTRDASGGALRYCLQMPRIRCPASNGAATLRARILALGRRRAVIRKWTRPAQTTGDDRRTLKPPSRVVYDFEHRRLRLSHVAERIASRARPFGHCALRISHLARQRCPAMADDTRQDRRSPAFALVALSGSRGVRPVHVHLSSQRARIRGTADLVRFRSRLLCSESGLHLARRFISPGRIRHRLLQSVEPPRIRLEARGLAGNLRCGGRRRRTCASRHRAAVGVVLGLTFVNLGATRPTGSPLCAYPDARSATAPDRLRVQPSWPSTL